MAYRLLLERRREEQLMLIQAQVDAGPPHGWVTVGEWTHPAPGRLTSKNRADPRPPDLRRPRLGNPR